MWMGLDFVGSQGRMALRVWVPRTTTGIMGALVAMELVAVPPLMGALRRPELCPVAVPPSGKMPTTLLWRRSRMAWRTAGAGLPKRSTEKASQARRKREERGEL